MDSFILARKGILLLVVIFIFNPTCVISRLVPPASSRLSPRNSINDTGSVSDPLITVTPVTFDTTLPWWTGVPGTTIDILIVASTVSGGWVPPTKINKPTTKASLIWNWFTTVLLFCQSISGLIHLLQSYRSSDRYALGRVQRLSGNSFAALFANSIRLWDRSLLDNPKTLLVAGWINITLSLLAFAILSLPIIGTAPLFQASSPFCTWVLNDGTGFQLINDITPDSSAVCGVYNWLNDSSLPASSWFSSLQTQIRCADADALRLGYKGAYNTLTSDGGYDSLMQSPWVAWAYAAVIVVLLFLTARMQLQWNFYRPVPVGQDKTEDKLEVWTGKVMMALAFLSLSISVSILIALHDREKAGFTGSVVVCPDVANSTIYTNLSNATCTCVDIRRKYEGSVKSVVKKEESTLGRFFYNFL